jgi:membrane-associated phospholipid phosphatase
MELIQQTDKAMLLFIQENLRCSFLDGLMTAASWIGDYGLAWIALGLTLILFRKTRRGALDMLFTLAVAAIICNLLLKNIIERPRPFMTIDELTLLISPLNDFSFPSGHACSSFASAASLAFTFRGKGALAFIPAAFISLSRIYVGIHYPSDVICGALIGVIVAWFIYKSKIKYPDLADAKHTVENR